MVANGQGLVDGAGVLGRGQGQAGAGGRDGVDHGLDEHLSGLLVAGRLHVGALGDDGVALEVNAQRSRRGKAVGHVRGDGEDALAGRGARALVVAGDAVAADVGGEEDEAVLALGDEARVVALVLLDRGVGAVEDGIKVGHAKGSVGLDLDGEDGVIQQGLANGELEPLVLGREGGDVGGGDVHELGAGSDTRVVKDARSGQGTSGQDDSSTIGKTNSLALASGGLEFDASHLRSGSYKSNDLGAELQGKVVEFLCQGQVSADGTSTLAILNVPGRITVDFKLLVGLLNHVDGLPAEVAEEVGQDRVQLLVVSLAVGRGQRRSGIALVQSLGGGSNIFPVPALRPLFEVVSRGVDKDHVVDGDTTAEDASRVVGRVLADVLAPYIEIANVGRQTGEVNLGQGVVPAESVVRAGRGSRSGSSLDEKDLLVSLSQSLGRDDTCRASSHNNVIVQILASSRGTEGQAQGSRESSQH